MKKVKQIVAAALVAAAVGTAGMTAFAATNASEEFWLDVKANSDIEFSSYAKKTNSYSVPAHATAYSGADPSTPVTINVYDSTELNYYNTLTYDAQLTENFNTTYMRYSRTGYPNKYDDFYLGGTSHYNVDLYGWWAP